MEANRVVEWDAFANELGVLLQSLVRDSLPGPSDLHVSILFAPEGSTHRLVSAANQTITTGTHDGSTLWFTVAVDGGTDRLAVSSGPAQDATHPTRLEAAVDDFLDRVEEWYAETSEGWGVQLDIRRPATSALPILQDDA